MKRLIAACMLVTGCASPPPPPPPPPCPEPFPQQAIDAPAPVATVAEPEPEPAPEPAPVAEPKAPEVGKLGYRQLWMGKPKGGWADAAVITPSGDLANVSRGTLAIHARHDGSVVEQANICGPVGPRAMRVLRGKLILACSDRVAEVTMPGLSHRVVVRDVLKSSSSLFREAAFGGDKLVYMHNDGALEVYSTKTWKKLESHKLDADTFAEPVAVSPDGKRYTVTNEKKKTVTLYGGGKPKPIVAMREVIAFSPDGKRVFGSSGSFEAGDVSIQGGVVRDLLKVGSWLTAAEYFGDDMLAVSGSDGVVVRNLKTHVEQKLGSMTAETLAVSPDGRLICSADRGDKIACYGKGTIKKSTYVR